MRHVLLVLLLLATSTPALGDPILPPRFDDIPVVEGLTEPVAVRFDAAGEIFVAEKAGRIKRFDPLPAPGSGVVVLDIRDQVMDYQDRGLLGLALHPQYPAVPYVYVLYTYDAAPGGVAPLWSDRCDNPTGLGGGCVVTGRLVRYTMASGMTGPQLVDPRILIQDDWYQQYPSHSIGDLAFGPDGMLYVSGGDGASYQFADVGDASQVNHTYPNPGDPPGDGGALRAQDLLTSGDPLGLNGSILRVDPDTGQAAAGNPLPGVRQVAFGLRNPFRFGFRPGTRELWIGDVGENAWEEINRIADATDGVIENFGWPCYEGVGTHAGFETHPDCAGLIHDSLPAGTPGKKTAPFFTYPHGQAPGSNLSPAGCQDGSSNAISGIAFYRGGTYPAQYQRALFFADYGVNCIYAMRIGAGGAPDPGQIDVIERAAAIPVSLEVGPGGDIFYTSIEGAIRRISYGAELTARASADLTTGMAPLTVRFDGSGSSDTAGDPLEYAWDLDGDGAFDDSTEVRPQRTYPQGVYKVRLQIKNRVGKTAVSQPITIAVSEAPVPVITAPADGAPWKTGERIQFAGTATDPQDGPLPASALHWRIILLHCPQGGCHQHPLETFDGVAGGSFVTAPDGYPAFYDIELTATDASGLTGKTTVRISAAGTPVSLETRPPGLALLYASMPLTAPQQVTEVAGQQVSLEALSPQEQGGKSYVFTGWSDGGDRIHAVTVPDTAAAYTATFEVDSDRDGIADSMDPCPGDPDPACTSHGGCAAAGSPPGPAALVLLGLGFARVLRRRRAARAPRTPRPGA